MTFFAVVFKLHFHFADFESAIALFARARHIELAHREKAYCGICELRGSHEVHNRKAERAHKAHIADGEAKSKFLVGNIVIIPLFEAGFLCRNVFTIVVVKHFFGKARFGNIAFDVQKVGGFGDFVLHNIPL